MTAFSVLVMEYEKDMGLWFWRIENTLGTDVCMVLIMEHDKHPCQFNLFKHSLDKYCAGLL